MSNLSEKNFINKILQDDEIMNFIDENHITNNEFNKYLETFMAYYLKKGLCKDCQGLSTCKQSRNGLVPLILKDGMYIDIDYAPCGFLEEANKDNLVNLHLYNTSITNIQGNVYVNNERKEVLTFIKKFLETYQEDPNQMGLYLYGKYGTGKSYIMGNFAIELARKGIDTAFVYYPDFVRYIKSLITTGGIDSLIKDLKRIPILFIDDFGGESNSTFIRDEILLPILQYRMVNKKPMFVTSNLSDKEIIDHLAVSNKEVDVIKAARIFERLRSLMKFMELKDKNYR